MTDIPSNIEDDQERIAQLVRSFDAPAPPSLHRRVDSLVAGHRDSRHARRHLGRFSVPALTAVGAIAVVAVIVLAIAFGGGGGGGSGSGSGTAALTVGQTVAPTLRAATTSRPARESCSPRPARRSCRWRAVPVLG